MCRILLMLGWESCLAVSPVALPFLAGVPSGGESTNPFGNVLALVR